MRTIPDITTFNDSLCKTGLAAFFRGRIDETTGGPR